MFTPKALPPLPYGGGITNEEIVQEFLLDPEFRLDTDPRGSNSIVTFTIRRAFEESFFDSVAVEMSGCGNVPPSYIRVLSVFEDVRESVRGLANGHVEEGMIGDIIDIGLITEQLAAGSFDYPACQKLLCDIITVLLSMHQRMKTVDLQRDTVQLWGLAHVQLLAASTPATCAIAVCNALMLILDRVHAVKVYISNADLMRVRPDLLLNGVDYLKTHFKRKLDKQIFDLSNTKLWIYHVVGVSSRQPFELGIKVCPYAIVDGNSDACEDIIHAAVMDLILNGTNWGGKKRGGEEEEEVRLALTPFIDLCFYRFE